MSTAEVIAFLLVIVFQAHNAWALHDLQKIARLPQYRGFAPSTPQDAPTDDEAYSIYAANGTWLFDRYPGHPDLALLENDPAYKVVKN